MKTFEELGLNQHLLEAIKEFGFEKPTLVQELTIPHILKGKDVIAESATGSGKTLAFGSGVISNVKHGKGLQALILAPTRELAEQVKVFIKELAGNKQLRVISVYGGVAMNPQIDALRTAEVVVATPGRFLDHMQRGTVDTSRISCLVLDEADRMLDMGFIDDVERIMGACSREKQTLFFTATMTDRLKALADGYMNKPVDILAQKMVDPEKLEQVYYDVEKFKKFSLLATLLEKEERGLVMVFCNTRRTTDFVAKNLKTNGINAVEVHGGLTQNKRNRFLGMFSDAKVGVLVCTDVAARGIDIDDISHVYNYEIPQDPTDYVHRIGRTARAGSEGKVINLICEYDHENFGRLLDRKRNYKIVNIPVPEPLKRVRVVKPSRDGARRSGPGGRRGNSRRSGNLRNRSRGPRR